VWPYDRRVAQQYFRCPISANGSPTARRSGSTKNRATPGTNRPTPRLTMLLSPTIFLISAITSDRFPSTCCRFSLGAECASDREQNRPSESISGQSPVTPDPYAASAQTYAKRVSKLVAGAKDQTLKVYEDAAQAAATDAASQRPSADNAVKQIAIHSSTILGKPI